MNCAKEEFKVGYDNYCVDISRKTVTIGLSGDDNAVTEKVGDPVSKIYLFERADQKRYLVIFTKYLWYGGYHVFPHKSVVEAQTFPHKSVMSSRKFPHKNVMKH